MRRGNARQAPGEHHHLQRRRQFLGLVAPLLALRADADPARADLRHDGLRPARRGRRRDPLSRPPGGVRRGRRRLPDERPGARDRRPIWRRPARHPRRQWLLRNDPHAPGTRLSEAHLRDRPEKPRLRRAGASAWRLGRDGRRRPPTSRRRSTKRSRRRASACSTAGPTSRSSPTRPRLRNCETRRKRARQRAQALPFAKGV